MDLREKYKHVTLEHIRSLDDQAIVTLRRDIDRDHGKVVMYLEHMASTGGISKDVAMQMRELLPPTMAMEGFTDRPSYNGYWMVEESLSTTAKVLIGAGVIAAVGVLGLVIAKILGAGKGVPKAEVIDKINEAAKSLEDLEAEENGRQYRAHLDAINARTQFLVDAADSDKMSYCMVHFFDGSSSKPDMIVRHAKLLEIYAKELESNLTFLTSGAISECERLGPEATTEDFNKKLGYYIANMGGGRNQETAIKNFVQPLHDVDDYFSEASPQFKKDALKRTTPEFPAYPMEELRRIQAVRDKFKNDLKLIDQAKDKLEGNDKISKDAGVGLRGGYDALAERLNGLLGALQSVDREIEEYNRAGATFSRAVGKSFEAVRERIQQGEFTEEERKKAMDILMKAYNSKKG